MDRERALKAIRELVGKSEFVSANKSNLAECIEWEQSARTAVEVAFGKGSKEWKKFSKLDFGNLVDANPPLNSDLLKFDTDRQKATGIMDGGLKEHAWGLVTESTAIPPALPEDKVTQPAEPPQESQPMNGWWLRFRQWPMLRQIVVGVAIGLPVTVGGGLALSYIQSKPSEDTKNIVEIGKDSTSVQLGADSASAELTRNDFEYWLWSFDETLGKELDSMKMDWRQRGVFNSGMAVTETIRFYEAKRMERDHVIDSFLISYSGQRGDTTQLSYSRKLPGNVGVGLTRWANSMDLDIHHHHVDTL